MTTLSGDRTIAVINSKGGVGKTTTVANLAGQLAGRFRVLAIDLDPQGHLGIPLGYYRDERDDQGRTILDAIDDDAPLGEPLRNVRDNLDVYAGGSRLARLQALEMSGHGSEPVATSFARKLADVAEDYDFVFIDCPPGDRLIQQMALTAARYVLVPIDTGVGSTESVRDHLAPLVMRTRQRDNDALTYLGAVVCKQPSTAQRMLRNTRLRLAEFNDHVPIFDAVIRNAAKTAQDSEQAGRLIHELAGESEESRKAYFAALRDGRTDELEVTRIGESASKLAADYRELARELLQRIAAHEETTPIRKSR